MTLHSLSNAERIERFGRFRFRHVPRPGNPEAIEITGMWVAEHIVTVQMPELAAFAPRGVRLHRLAADPFRALIRAWRDEGVLGELVSWNGSFVPRFKRGSLSDLSNHSWGTAFDINAHLYPLGVSAAPDAPIRKLVPAATRFGWAWGGDFHHRPDPMHFEYVGLQSEPAV